MSHGPTRFSSKGRCIYCGRDDVNLTDEHVVPLSLGGQHVIEGASCSSCAKIATKFERDVAREMWGDARIHYSVFTGLRGVSRRGAKLRAILRMAIIVMVAHQSGWLQDPKML